jgi:hypothetical protein
MPTFHRLDRRLADVARLHETHLNSSRQPARPPRTLLRRGLPPRPECSECPLEHAVVAAQRNLRSHIRTRADQVREISDPQPGREAVSKSLHDDVAAVPGITTRNALSRAIRAPEAAPRQLRMDTNGRWRIAVLRLGAINSTEGCFESGPEISALLILTPQLSRAATHEGGRRFAGVVNDAARPPPDTCG